MSSFDTEQEKHSFFEKVKYYFYEHLLAISLAFSRLRRLPLQTLASTFLIAFSLSLAIIFAFFIKSTQEIPERLLKSSVMTLYLNEQVNEQELKKFYTHLESYAAVGQIEYISSDVIAQEVFGDQLPALLEQSLPTLLSVSLKDIPAQYQEDKYLLNMKNQLADHPLVYQVSLDQTWHSQLFSLIHLGQVLSWGLGLVLLSTVLIIINYTIYMTLEKYRDEISIYHDLGAQLTFIQRPFLYQGFLLASLGSLMTLMILSLSYVALSQDLSKIGELVGLSLQVGYDQLIVMFQLLGFVIVFAWTSAYISMRRWLNLFAQTHEQA